MKFLELLSPALVALSITRAISVPPSTLDRLQSGGPVALQAQCSCECPSKDTVIIPSIRRSERSPHSEVSLSPDNPSSSSSSATNWTQSRGSHDQSSSNWPPTTETLVTAVFRAIITILSLLNVGFTWRIHGNSICIMTLFTSMLTSVEQISMPDIAGAHGAAEDPWDESGRCESFSVPFIDDQPHSHRSFCLYHFHLLH